MLIIGFVVAQAILLIVIIFLLKRMIFSDTNSAISRLSRLDGINREKEKVLTQKLEDAQKFIDEQKKMMEEEAVKMTQESKRAANQLHTDMMTKAKTESEEIMQKAKASQEQMRVEAMIKAESMMIDICLEMINEVLTKETQSALNDHLVNEFISELEKADLSKINSESEKAEIISARGISAEQDKKIKNIVNDKLKKPMKFSASEDSKLIGGVMLRVGTTLIDGSLSERLKESAESFKQKLEWKYT